MDERLAWLLSCAAHLARGKDVPVPIVEILTKNKVELVVSLQGATNRERATLRVGASGNYVVEINRRSDSLVVSPAETFSLAHELAHILLIRAFRWHPSEGSDFHKCESFCNRFAAELLMPEKVFQNVAISTASQALDLLFSVASKCNVTNEAAGRRIPDCVRNVAFFGGWRKKNAQGSHVFALVWAGSSLERLSLRAGSHHASNTVIGAAALGWEIENAHVGASRRLAVVAPPYEIALYRKNDFPGGILGACVQTETRTDTK